MALKKQPSPWSKLPLIALRLVQLLGVLVVFAVTGYFNYYLLKDGYKIPWEFIVLDVVAALTLCNITSSVFLICLGRLGIRPVMIIDGVLSLFWAASFGVLARAMGKTTLEKCDVYNWGNSDGIRICYMYKLLFSFTVLSWLFHLGSFISASTIHSREKKHAYAPALNPANLRAQKTSYKPTHTPSGSISYGAQAPPIYTSAPDYTAGKDSYA